METTSRFKDFSSFKDAFLSKVVEYRASKGPKCTLSAALIRSLNLTPHEINQLRMQMTPKLRSQLAEVRRGFGLNDDPHPRFKLISVEEARILTNNEVEFAGVMKNPKGERVVAQVLTEECKGDLYDGGWTVQHGGCTRISFHGYGIYVHRQLQRNGQVYIGRMESMVCHGEGVNYWLINSTTWSRNEDGMRLSGTLQPAIFLGSMQYDKETSGWFVYKDGTISVGSRRGDRLSNFRPWPPIVDSDETTTTSISTSISTSFSNAAALPHNLSSSTSTSTLTSKAQISTSTSTPNSVLTSSSGAAEVGSGSGSGRGSGSGFSSDVDEDYSHHNTSIREDTITVSGSGTGEDEDEGVDIDDMGDDHHHNHDEEGDGGEYEEEAEEVYVLDGLGRGKGHGKSGRGGERGKVRFASDQDGYSASHPSSTVTSSSSSSSSSSSLSLPPPPSSSSYFSSQAPPTDIKLEGYPSVKRKRLSSSSSLGFDSVMTASLQPTQQQCSPPPRSVFLSDGSWKPCSKHSLLCGCDEEVLWLVDGRTCCMRGFHTVPHPVADSAQWQWLCDYLKPSQRLIDMGVGVPVDELNYHVYLALFGGQDYDYHHHSVHRHGRSSGLGVQDSSHSSSSCSGAGSERGSGGGGGCSSNAIIVDDSEYVTRNVFPNTRV